MNTVVLSCGPGAPDAHDIGPRPGKAAVDPFLDARRLIVLGTDADLAAVVLRLLRTEKLEDIEVGYVPSGPSEVPVTSTPASARSAAPVRVPLVRDDNGGVLLGLGVLEAEDATVYCDSTPVLRGTGRVEVRPGPEGLRVRVRRRGPLRRAVGAAGRAVQFGCAPTRPVSDGVDHPRQVERWSWYRHVTDLRLVGTC